MIERQRIAFDAIATREYRGLSRMIRVLPGEWYEGTARVINPLLALHERTVAALEVNFNDREAEA